MDQSNLYAYAQTIALPNLLAWIIAILVSNCKKIYASKIDNRATGQCERIQSQIAMQIKMIQTVKGQENR